MSKKGTSRFFSMTFVVTPEKDYFDRSIRKIFRKFQPKNIQKLWGVLHAHLLDEKQKNIVISALTSLNFKIFTIIVDKSQRFVSDDPHVLYALIANKLLHYLSDLWYDNLEFIASRRYTAKSINQKFTEYLLHATHIRGQKTICTINLPRICKWLQIADFCSRSIFRKYEFWDIRYYDMLYSPSIWVCNIS